MPCQLVDRLTESQTADLTRLYQNEWWSRGRTLEETRDVLATSDVVIGLAEEHTDRLIGFCRVLTDFVFVGTLYDVIVDPEFRGRGLGRRLMKTVSEHPRLSRLKKLYLGCKPDMAEFYAASDYEPVGERLVWMVRQHRTLDGGAL